MKRLTLIVIVGMFLAIGSQAKATTDAELQDTWINAFPTNQVVPIFGTLEWSSLTFATNGTVTWTWQRDGRSETNSGTYRLVAETDRPNLRPVFNVMIHPKTMAVWRDITLADIMVDQDNRFPVSWTVLKWRDEAGNRMTFIRQENDKTRRTTPPTVP
jgi:hypothetical protein